MGAAEAFQNLNERQREAAPLAASRHRPRGRPKGRGALAGLVKQAA